MESILRPSLNSLENVSTSNVDIGSISVQNSTDITFGNKTFFKGPVVINHLVAMVGEHKPNKTETKPEQFSRKTFDCFRKRPLLVGLILTAFVIIIIAVIVAGCYLNISVNLTPPTNETNDDDYKLINRSQYGAAQSNKTLNPIRLPAIVIIIARTLSENCTNYAQCKDRVLQIQSYHMNENSWDDIGWNFLVGGDGNAYEGSGWYGIDAIRNKNLTISISFIGNFTDHGAPRRQLYAVQRFIEDGINMNLIHPKTVIITHSGAGWEYNLHYIADVVTYTLKYGS